MTAPVQDAFNRLLERYGPQHWWPGEGPLEILVGTVLVQNTNWRNVEKAIVNLREAGVMTPEKLYALDPEELSELIRPAGYYQVKTKRLRNLLRLIVGTMLRSIPSLGNVIVLLGLILYVYAVLGVHLFAGADPAHWGSLPRAPLTLFEGSI